MARVGDDHGVVLVLTEEVETFGIEDAENLERNVADAEGLADGIGVGEELVGDGLADDGDLGDGADVLVGEHGSGGDFPRADVGVVGRFAVDLGVPIEAVGEDLVAVAHFGADADDAGDFALDRLVVFDGEGGGAAPTAAHAALAHAAGEDGDDVLAEAGDLGFDLGFGAVADAHHGDDGADADDDAERGEDGAHGIAQEGAEGDFDDGAEAHGGRRRKGTGISVGRR